MSECFFGKNLVLKPCACQRIKVKLAEIVDLVRNCCTFNRFGSFRRWTLALRKQMNELQPSNTRFQLFSLLYLKHKCGKSVGMIVRPPSSFSPSDFFAIPSLNILSFSEIFKLDETITNAFVFANLLGIFLPFRLCSFFCPIFLSSFRCGVRINFTL